MGFVIGRSKRPAGDIISPRNKHKWTAFVRLQNHKQNDSIHNVIAKVKFGLNKSFGVTQKELMVEED